MAHWCGSGSDAVVIVKSSDLREGQVPFGVPEGTPPMDAGEAAWRAPSWFDEHNASSARSLFLHLGYNLDYVDRHDINRRIARDFESGHLVAYPMWPNARRDDNSGRTTTRPAPPAPSMPRPTSPPPVAAVTPTHFSVRWVDELGVALGGLEVGFSISGVRHKSSTDSDGIAHYTDPNGAGFAWAEPPSVDDLREVLGPRWDRIREGKVLEDGEAHVVMLRAPIEGTSLVAEELETLSVQPYVERVRLLGEHFERNKCFLVPEGLAGARAILADKARLKTSCLHIVGHTDTSGDPEYNDQLSLERAEALQSYLKHDVDGWLVWYKTSTPTEKRWGSREDLLMIDAMQDHVSRPAAEPAVRWYQRTRGLAQDDIAGPITRAKLIGEYMALGGSPLPKRVTVTLHGCGESFPRTATGDGVANEDNRRVEAYFFDGSLGVQPPAPGATSKPRSLEYPEWVKRSRRTEDYRAQNQKGIVAFRIKREEDDSLVANAVVRIRTPNGEIIERTADALGEVRILANPGEKFFLVDVNDLHKGQSLTSATNDFYDHGDA